MGDNSFAPGYPQIGFGTFVVQNITTNPPKVVRLFNYPVNPPGYSGNTRDLLLVPGVAESDIRSSLLKGELKHKLLAGEITILSSDVDLLQFNANQAAFLYNSGVATGIQIASSQEKYVLQINIGLVGAVDGVNTTFTIPSGTFIQNGYNKIIVYLNGVRQEYLIDYTIAASDGDGAWDTVIMTSPPEDDVEPIDFLSADYYQVNTP